MAYLRATTILAERELDDEEYDSLYDSLSECWFKQRDVKAWEREHNVELSGFYIWGDINNTLGFSPPGIDCVWLTTEKCQTIIQNEDWDSLPGYSDASELRKRHVRESIVKWLDGY